MQMHLYKKHLFPSAADSNYCELCPWLFICKFFQRKLQVGQVKSYDVSTGLVHVKTIAVLTEHVQYLVEKLLS